MPREWEQYCGKTIKTLGPSKSVCALLSFAVATLAASMTFAAEPFRVLLPSGGTPYAAVLLVPGCSGFVARNGINHYDERASELQGTGYAVVFVDYLGRRELTACAGGPNSSHDQVSTDILEAAMWIKGHPLVAPDKVFAIGWS